jgi:hypothetical protein
MDERVKKGQHCRSLPKQRLLEKKAREFYWGNKYILILKRLVVTYRSRNIPCSSYITCLKMVCGNTSA